MDFSGRSLLTFRKPQFRCYGFMTTPLQLSGLSFEQVEMEVLNSFYPLMWMKQLQIVQIIFAITVIKLLSTLSAEHLANVT